MKWFRMYAEFANDPKVQMLSESDQRRYMMLLCIRCNEDVTLHDEQISFQLRISTEEWTKTKAILIGRNLITRDNKPTSWDKRQYKSDDVNQRVKHHRDNLKQSSNVTNKKSNALDTDTDTEIDTEEETETEKNKITPAGVVDRKAPSKKSLAPLAEIENNFINLWVAWKPFDIDKGSKDAAKKSYLKARKEVSHAEIIEGCERYLAYCHAKQQRTQHIVTFLNQRNWEGEYPTPNEARTASNGKPNYADSIGRAAATVIDNQRREEDLRSEEIN